MFTLEKIGWWSEVTMYKEMMEVFTVELDQWCGHVCEWEQ